MKFSRCLAITAAAAGLLIAGIASEAQATTYLDTYIGGTNPGGFVGLDVVSNTGDHRFDITSMDVTRIGDSLNVVINTNYSGANVGAIGTNLGDLFLGKLGNLSLTAFSDPLDTFTGDVNRFSNVFDINGTPSTGPNDSLNDAPVSQGGAATLYTLNETGSDVVLSHDALGGFRHNQAVDTTSTTATGPTGTWATTTGSVTFNIANFFSTGGLGANGGIYATGLVLAWAMTCANDVILAKVQLFGDSTPQVPLPAGLLLLLSGLTGLGFLGRFKRKVSKALV